MSDLTTIKAQSKKNPELGTAEVTYDFGGTVEAAIEKFGADVVYANFVRAATITAQSVMRRLLETGKNAEEIAQTMAEWKPGVAFKRSADPVSSVLSKFSSLSPEEQKALIKQLQKRAAGE